MQCDESATQDLSMTAWLTSTRSRGAFGRTLSRGDAVTGIPGAPFMGKPAEYSPLPLVYHLLSQRNKPVSGNRHLGRRDSADVLPAKANQAATVSGHQAHLVHLPLIRRHPHQVLQMVPVKTAAPLRHRHDTANAIGVQA